MEGIIDLRSVIGHPHSKYFFNVEASFNIVGDISSKSCHEIFEKQYIKNSKFTLQYPRRSSIDLNYPGR